MTKQVNQKLQQARNDKFWEFMMEFADDFLRFALLLTLGAGTAALINYGKVEGRVWDTFIGFALGAGSTASMAALKGRSRTNPPSTR
jgi:hypothetical protein